MECRICHDEIPEARIKVLPHTHTCVACSDTGRVAGFPIISGKTTYSEIQLVAQDTAQELYRQQDRTGGVATGVQFRSMPPPKLSNFE